MTGTIRLLDRDRTWSIVAWRTIMKIVVIGGSGLIGKQLVNILRQKDTRPSRPRPHPASNTLTREGLAEAVSDAQAVVDVANSPSFEDKAVLEFFERSSRNLLAAEAAAGVGHHVALSIVGTDRLPDSGYLRAKTAQEKLIKGSGIPYTILRARSFSNSSRASSSRRRWRCHPHAIRAVPADGLRRCRRRAADLVVGPPLNRTVEVGGPNASGSMRWRGDFWPPPATSAGSSATLKPPISAPGSTIVR